ncbi:MAG: DNA polymerase II large subunit [Candidatus Diapherotrites archaeon]|uniref:DNA polymerase II large subunit n=1 Tax=Candidatus Iainarchaeum sp. TaxID=3101447 RepID=A0A938YNE3_9ARCH|nr:DNA polymerase II large subunit [Candidatus Diapherotrites archaeon]
MALEIEIEAEQPVKDYYSQIIAKVKKELEIAESAKKKGLDVSTEIETTPVADLADRTETIIGPPGVAKRYRQLFKEKNGNRMDVIFEIFREIIEQKWCKIADDQKRVEQAIKTGLVINTEGVVVAPLDGVPEIKISKNPDGSKYIDIYYAGPIRAAGGTSAVLPLILGDYARQLLSLDRYKPTEDEIERYVEECQIYEEIVSRQYKLSDEEVRKIIRGCNVCINGEPTEEREVAVHRNLQRVESNRVRGGMCLVISEGVALKAPKILKFANQLGLDWSWLEGIIKVGKSETGERKIEPNPKFLEGAAAGRPIFCYPSRPGGFRLRYGRARNMGAMGKGMHPATMHLLDEFVAVATQIKVERPGKAAGICPVDSIEGPIVRLVNGSVVKVNSLEEAIELKPKVEKILFLGDLLVSVGDFRYSAHPLAPVGYCSEWWSKEIEKLLEKNKIGRKDFERALENPESVQAEEAVELSEKHKVPLHPNALHYYSALEKDELIELAEMLKKDKGEELEMQPGLKELLEKIGVPHTMKEKKIVLGRGNTLALQKTLGIEKEIGEIKRAIEKSESVVEALKNLSGLDVRDKAGTFIGSRMGRPEASRPRKMIGNPHVLFPIGMLGGNTRSINKAMASSEDGKEGRISVEIALYKCPKCRQIKEEQFCHSCRERTHRVRICPNCGIIVETEKCQRCNAVTASFSKRELDLGQMLHDASQRLGMKVPDLVKGVKGTINKDKVAEPLEKGLLRAKHDMHIFRDATIRYEAINAPLTHFTAGEIGTSVEKLRELGYSKDIGGKELKEESQMLELMPQDIVIHDEAGDFFAKTTKFIDDLLERFYKIKPYFNVNSRQDLIGEILLGLAPHTSAAIVGRVIGYTKARCCFAHPFFHQTKRRNIDGDQDSLLLLMDGLLNFSHSYLPSSRGGRMDAPLVFTIALKPSEIDNECHEMEKCSSYPLELYEAAQKIMPADSVPIEVVGDSLEKKGQYTGFGFTHSTSVFDAGPVRSRYVVLNTMEEKLRSQARLQGKIAACDAKDALERVVVTHLIPDIIGNTRAFSRQQFRCTTCNNKARRPPLDGKCPKCGKPNLILTIAEGSVRKYLVIAKQLAKENDLSAYLQQRLELAGQEIDSIFQNEQPSQKKLAEFV